MIASSARAVWAYLATGSWRALLVADDTGVGHGAIPSGLERKAEGGEQRSRLVVFFAVVVDADVEASQNVDFRIRFQKK